MTLFHFAPSALTAQAGTVMFFLKNIDEVRPELGPGTNHSLAIGSVLGEPLASSEYVENGEAAVFTVEGLEAGAYVIWCQVPDHAEMGMVGSLTVTP
jgi:plastocyanin